MSSATRTLVSPAVLARPRGRAVYWTVFTGILVLFALAFLFPVYWMASGAMKSPDEVARTPPTLVPQTWSTSGYTDAWELMRLPTHLWNTVVQAAGAWLFQLVFCTAAAYALSRLRPAFGKLILGGILATLMVPAQALVVPKYLTVADLGLLNDPLAIWLPAVANAFNIEDFAVIGEVTERVDSSPDNFVNGSLGPDSSVSGMWLQHLKVGLWLTGTNDNLVVEDSRFLDMTADGLNLNGNARGVKVRNNFLRNQGDDALAMWSLNAPNTNSSFENNTVSQPNLANGIAIYGGTDITVRNNLVTDTNALGSGIAISNQKFLDPFHPLAGTITVDGNTLVRTGAMNPNWNHPMGALRVDSYDSAIEAQVRITNTTVTDSPYSAFEFVSGSGRGFAARNITVDGATVNRAGTVVVQAETQGAATFRNVTATGVGSAGVYNCPYPSGSGTFTLTDGGGNSGWDSTWSDCSTWPQPGQGNPDPGPDRNLAQGRPATATGSQDVYTPGKAVDGDAGTYWESTNNAFPQSLTVDLGSAQAVRRVVLKLPPQSAWQARTQTLSVQGGTDGSSYATLAASKAYRFDPATGNTVTIPVSGTVRHLRLHVTGNTGWPAAQFGEVEAYLS
ncbi:discoidin domain-containing protein [Streptomyces sp. NPDC014986]|uniref:discoidin domain-containing protein n=1 Tax=Streptomyces sp. NPDC014986 TaxID=3364934 RepID=UPI0036FC9016